MAVRGFTVQACAVPWKETQSEGASRLAAGPHKLSVVLYYLALAPVRSPWLALGKAEHLPAHSETLRQDTHLYVCPCRALLAVCLLVAGAQADDAAQIATLESSKSVFLPTTPNDFSGMIYSLLQEQSSRIANKDGAQVSSIPSHVAALHATLHACACLPLYPFSCATPLQNPLVATAGLV